MTYKLSVLVFQVRVQSVDLSEPKDVTTWNLEKLKASRDFNHGNLDR